MKRCIIVLFVLICSISFAQANKPTTFSFDSLTEYIRNFDFIASGTTLPSIQKSGIRFILWKGNKPTEYISDGTNWQLQKPVKSTSAGALELPTFIDNEDSTIQVNACCISLYTDELATELPDKFNFQPATFTLTDNSINYIVANYNNGNPQLQKITDVTTINETTIIPLFTIYRHDTHNHALNWDTLGLSLSNKLHQRLVKTNRFAREYGLSVTTNNLEFAVSEGRVWYGATFVNLEEINSIDGYVRLICPNGSFTPIITLNNTQYCSNNSIQELNPNRYAVNWIYRSVEMNKTIYVMLGDGNYTLEEAQNANPPATPSVVKNMAILVAKVVYKKDNIVPHSIQSAFDRYYSYAT